MILLTKDTIHNYVQDTINNYVQDTIDNYVFSSALINVKANDKS